MSTTRIVAAMSGGVDSSVAAGLLCEAGYEVIGLFLRNGAVKEDAAARTRSCCSVSDARDAERVAARLGIPFYVLDYQREFGRLVDHFVSEYLGGRTPNPCVRCNQWIKFGALLEFARGLGAEALATGHYARIGEVNGTPRLLRAVDAAKDQSYFLFAIGADALPLVRFPIGHLRKPDVRAEAARMGLPVAEKPESQEICFVPDGDAGQFVADHGGTARGEGVAIDEEGRPLGRHAGFFRYTIGQRKGVRIAAGKPLYVLETRPDSNTVVLGPDDALRCDRFTVTELQALGPDLLSESESSDGVACEVQIRHRHTAIPARVKRLDGRRAEVVLERPERAVTPGQAAVFYCGDEVLGGAFIDHAERKVSPLTTRES
ncbi:MAG: tRNA 2-thiouridine(34) synthase MnmA [Planctomycetes bacterium]|nr:tRNA 2-thiouridine(34) synthase MnmA [Planctomycetota bacterium]